MLSQNKLLFFDPSVYYYNVSLINTKLQALFVLVRTRYRTISEFNKLQHAINVYDQIKQPLKWKPGLKPINNTLKMVLSITSKPSLILRQSSTFQSPKSQDFKVPLSSKKKISLPCSPESNIKQYLIQPMLKRTTKILMAHKIMSYIRS